jgi:hypothetical protein
MSSLVFPLWLLCPMWFVAKLIASSVLRGLHLGLLFLLYMLFNGTVSCQDCKTFMIDACMNMGHLGMILAGESWSTERKTCHFVHHKSLMGQLEMLLSQHVQDSEYCNTKQVKYVLYHCYWRDCMCWCEVGKTISTSVVNCAVEILFTMLREHWKFLICWLWDILSWKLLAWVNYIWGSCMG